MKRSRSICLIALGSMFLSGCTVGHTWFQMNSNSPMPFFGFDLLPRRSTSAKVDPSQTHFVKNTETKRAATSTVSSGVASNSPDNSTGKLRLRRISDFLTGSREEEIDLTGPQYPFAP
ncbi:hypothetical protein KOR42_20360 [Thalassoglobus neptunius]|uniref:Lipoprotein n=1 Tax=Thalassoglobus neptunius TaxID=1938619 RepID=A0A5C5X6X4_9PLAN|nr:hypothetical protein [Thalassoglobus neptunius]TWT58654.1 hypothetical protein KOR42_20360 [Thalassoglobus neptunius]